MFTISLILKVKRGLPEREDDSGINRAFLKTNY